MDGEGSGGRWEDAPGTVPREEPAHPVKAPPGPTAARAIGHPTWPTVLAVALFVRAQFCDLRGPSRSLSDNNSGESLCSAPTCPGSAAMREYEM